MGPAPPSPPPSSAASPSRATPAHSAPRHVSDMAGGRASTGTRSGHTSRPRLAVGGWPLAAPSAAPPPPSASPSAPLEPAAVA